MKSPLVIAAAALLAAGCASVARQPQAAAPTSAAAPAAAPPGTDPRIATALKALGYTYDVTEDKDYKLVFETGDDKRTQLVVINSNTEFYDQLEIREVWSPALLVEDPLDTALAMRLLRANDKYKLGAWRVWPADKSGDKPQVYVVFAAQIDANAPDSVLSATLDMVSHTADELEKEIAKADER
jgi:hypothetical protein